MKKNKLLRVLPSLEIIIILFLVVCFAPAFADDVSPFELSSDEQNDSFDTDIPPLEIVYYDPNVPPTTAVEWLQASFAAQMLGDIDAAVDSMLNATLLEPDSAPYHAGYSALLTTQGNYEDAYAAAQKSLSLDPENVMAWSALGDAASMLNRIDEAIHAYEYALSLDPTFESASTIQYNIGSLYLDQGKFQEARMSFEQALESGDSYAALWLNKGVAEYGMGDYVNASQSFEQAVTLDPSVPCGVDNLNATREMLSPTKSSPLGPPIIFFSLGAGLLYLRRRIH